MDKWIQEILPIHQAKFLSYMRLQDIPLGLIIKFPETKLTGGLVRRVPPGANRQKGYLTEANEGNEEA